MSVIGNTLPRGFEPGPNHVIIGRGKMNFNHTGNLELRRIVASRLEEYSATTTKSEKSKIIGSVLEDISKRDPVGGFVKQDEKTSDWFNVGEFMSKDKISQTFRDLLRGNYKSSNDYKKKRRRHENQKLRQQMSNVITDTINNTNNAINDRHNNTILHLNQMNQLSSSSFLQNNQQQQNNKNNQNLNLNQLNRLNHIDLQNKLEQEQLVQSQLQHLKQLKQRQQQLEEQGNNLNLQQHQQMQSLTDHHRRMSLQGGNNNGESRFKRERIANANTSSLINLPLELNRPIVPPEPKIHQQLEPQTLLPTTTLSMQNGEDSFNNRDQQLSATFFEKIWNSKYLELLDFHKQFGNCNVPISYKNQALVNWVIDQRQQYKCLFNGKVSTLNKTKIDLLNSVGFNWKNNSPIGAMLSETNNSLDNHRRMSLQNSIANKNSIQMMNQHRRMSLQSNGNTFGDINNDSISMINHHRRMSLQSSGNTFADNNNSNNRLQQMMNHHRRMSLQSTVTDNNENPLQQMMNNRRMSLQNPVTHNNENPLQQMMNNRRMSLPNILENGISVANFTKLANLNNGNISDDLNNHRFQESSTSNNTDTLFNSNQTSAPHFKRQKMGYSNEIDACSTSSRISSNDKKKRRLSSVNSNKDDVSSSNNTASSLITASTISDNGSNKSSDNEHDDNSDSDTNSFSKNASDYLTAHNLKPPLQHEENWMQRYEELILFLKENGDCCVPFEYSKNPKLGHWAEYERQQRNKVSSKSSTNNLNKITKKRIQLLDSIGFVWDSEEVRWRTDLSFLEQIQQQESSKTNSSKNVIHHSKYEKLKRSLVKQYLNYYEGRSTSLTSSQIFDLEKLGFSRYLTKI